ncbi:oligosaccharide flippase family protein [Clostridium estertheticum]|uniref:Oligosaccharide flippase family protein n=1 Tax=Clostridium estertheticum TaxID=238834 RepID=A0AA47EH27_9CLOT|nr:oligosaccharide flippase family protein [Clostridium estertheticum]MBU3155555.1 oligosaccharide flippase family protein [Clostridium estertheticum]WAG60047.1 oligosaccharide flippase family protein [Clostridium estertheticum]
MKNGMKKAVIITYITIIIGNVISLMYTPFMLSKLGKAEYGLFSLVNSIVAYIYLLDLGFGNAVIRYNSKYMVEKNEDGRKKVNGMFLSLYLILGLISMIVGVIIYFNLGKIMSKSLSLDEINRTKQMFMVAIVNISLSFPLSIFNSIITAHEKFVYIKIINLLRTILNPAIMITVLLFGSRAFGMVIGSTVFNILLGLVNVIYCFKILKLKIKFAGFDKALFAEIFNYSFFVFLSAIAYQIYWNSDQLILAIFVGAAPIAIYAVSSQFNTYFLSLSNVLSSMFLPKLTKMVTVEENRNDLMRLLTKIGRIQYYICSYIFVGFVLVGKQFIVRWVGEGYSFCYVIAIILMFPQIFSIIQSLFATMLEAMNKHRVKAYIYLSIAIINILLSIVLVQKYQGLGCAIGTAIGMIINAVANNIYYKFVIKLDIKYFWMNILKLVIPTTITFGLGFLALSLFSLTSYISILMFGILFTIIYFIVFWIMGFNKYEKKIFISVLNKGRIKQ